MKPDYVRIIETTTTTIHTVILKYDRYDSEELHTFVRQWNRLLDKGWEFENIIPHMDIHDEVCSLVVTMFKKQIQDPAMKSTGSIPMPDWVANELGLRCVE